MVEGMKAVVPIYVDRSRHQWVVRGRKGNLWIVPSEKDLCEQMKVLCDN